MLFTFTRVLEVYSQLPENLKEYSRKPEPLKYYSGYQSP